MGPSFHCASTLGRLNCSGMALRLRVSSVNLAAGARSLSIVEARLGVHGLNGLLCASPPGPDSDDCPRWAVPSAGWQIRPSGTR